MAYIDQRMSHELRLSPQHVLFSTLLQMPMMALEQRIKAELETNPMLEELAEEESDESADDTDSLDETDSSEDTDDTGNDEDEFDIEDFMSDQDDLDYGLPKHRDDEEDLSLPDPAPVTLTEHLMTQLHLQKLEQVENDIGEYIIWNINEDGYLSCTLEDISEVLQQPIEYIIPVLSLIQTFEPTGIGARNLQECLLIQLRDQASPSSLAISIIQDHFVDFTKKRFEKLAKDLDVSLMDIKTATERISKLNPKPGEGYIIPNQNYIIPDVLVEKVGEEFVITLNDGSIPMLRISNAYRNILSQRGKVPKETRHYIKQKIESARWLINSIQQRKVTILKVMKEIVHRQEEFFEKGKGFMKPMILKDIASVLGMDISTVARVTKGKYVQTDYGVFELKYFFSEKMTTTDGEDVSTLNIKEKLKEIIANEDSKAPLTDDKLVHLLKAEGIPIARRTVAKYREQLRIPVARLRRSI